jgi:tripartite-type tricarboxylate transporter receptor subunit TctC
MKALVLAGAFCGFALSVAADPLADFYRDKQMRLLVHTTPGGGYDAYARLMARHIVNHIPGSPTIVVQNMPGGGGLRQANHVGNTAPKDGTTLALISQGLPLLQIAGGEADNTKLEVDFLTFHWIGNLSDSNQILVTWHTSPVKTFADALTTPEMLGASGVGSISVQLPSVVNHILGTKFKIITGYPAGNEMNLAMERGEINGRTANTLASYKATHPHFITEKKFNYIFQTGLAKEPELPDVPLLTDLATNDLDRGVLQVMTNISEFGRPVATTPGVPQDRVAALRQAFQAMLKDRPFIDEAEKSHMEIGDMNGEQVEKLVAEIINAPKPVVERLVKAMELPKDATQRSKAAAKPTP